MNAELTANAGLSLGFWGNIKRLSFFVYGALLSLFPPHTLLRVLLLIPFTVCPHL